jgi:hypothetical protein
MKRSRRRCIGEIDEHLAQTDRVAGRASGSLNFVGFGCPSFSCAAPAIRDRCNMIALRTSARLEAVL